jgi:transcriptional regulator with XRE-family HTH domain
MKTLQNVVGPQIRKLRYNKGWSQAKLAIELNLKGLEVEREFVAQIEGQTHCVKDKDLPYFAAALGVPLTDLFPKFTPGRSVHETMTILLEDRRNGHAMPIVTIPLQLVAAKNGK